MRTFNQQQNDLTTSAQIQGMNTGLQAQQLQNQQAANIKNLANPGYVNPYTQAAVPGADILGAYTTNQGQLIAQQNANNAAAANTRAGLYGLGSSALLGSGGLGNLAGTVGSGITGLAGLGSSAYNWLTGNNAPQVGSDWWSSLGNNTATSSWGSNLGNLGGDQTWF
jgi:hypothetical protein